VWNVLLAARAEDLGGVMTTMSIRGEPELKDLLEVPDHLAVAAVVALGYPVQAPRRLTRAAVSSFTMIDRFSGHPFPGR